MRESRLDQSTLQPPTKERLDPEVPATDDVVGGRSPVGEASAQDNQPCQRLSVYSRAELDRGAGPVKEAAWLLCRGLLFWPSWLRAYRTKAFTLRRFGARVGEGLVAKPGVKIAFPWKLTLGDHVWLGEDAYLLNLAPITIGSDVCISQRAFLCTGSHDWSDVNFRLIARPIVVEDGVWICGTVFVGAGVTIGAKAVVTAGSVVTEDLPGGMICSGNPCVPIKKRKMRSPDGVD